MDNTENASSSIHTPMLRGPVPPATEKYSSDSFRSANMIFQVANKTKQEQAFYELLNEEHAKGTGIEGEQFSVTEHP